MGEKRIVPTSERCAKRIWEGFHNYPCKRRGTIMRDGKLYCGQHDPEAVKARREKSAAEFRAKREAERAEYARAQRIAEAERRVIEAAEAWRSGIGCVLGLTVTEALEQAVDALREARKEK